MNKSIRKIKLIPRNVLIAMAYYSSFNLLYIEQELVFEEELISSSWTHAVYPLGHLGDIDIHFLHYKN